GHCKLIHPQNLPCNGLIFQYDSSLASIICSIGKNFIFVSSNSMSGSESRMTPHHANKHTSSAWTSTQRKATANSLCLLLSTQPIGAPYQPRSNHSCSRIKARAVSRGTPPKAGVG